MAEAEFSPERILEEIRKLKVSDVLVSSYSTVAQLVYAKLDASTRDLEQARLGIEALRALLPVLEGAVPEDVGRDFKQLLANVQLAYADASAHDG